MTRIEAARLSFTGQESKMELVKQTRFEQVPLAVALKIAREQAKATKIRIAKKMHRQNEGAK
jgi:hypothetical protein